MIAPNGSSLNIAPIIFVLAPPDFHDAIFATAYMFGTQQAPFDALWSVVYVFAVVPALTS